MKLHPYQQSSVEQRTNKKLSPKYYGAFKIIKNVNTVAYTLDLPEGSLIHPTFHVSLLKKKIGAKNEVATELPPLQETKKILKLIAVLDRAIYKKGNKAEVKWLIAWEGLSLDESTWEDV